MACDLYLAPSFPQLEDRLLDLLVQRADDEPLRPRWVVVPTSTLAHHLRRRAAAASGVMAGVRIVPLDILIARLRQRLGPATARWEPLLDLLIQETAGRIPPTSALARLRGETAAFDLLSPTFRDLADAGFGPDQQELLEELAGDPELRPVESDLLRLYSGWTRLLAGGELQWQPLADQQLAPMIETVPIGELRSMLGAEPDQNVEVLVHGFYEFTDVNTEIVCALAGRLALTLLFPMLVDGSSTHPAFEFAASYLDDLKLRLGPALGDVATEDPATPTSRFFAASFPEGSVGDQPEWLTLQPACGRRAEVVAAAARIRSWLDEDDSVGAEDIVVVVPDPAGYIDAVREVFTQFAVPVRMSDIPIALEADTRQVKMLARLWREQAPAELLLAFLAEAPGLARRRSIDLQHFESELRRAGCWGGVSLQALVDMSSQGLTSLTDPEVQLLCDVIDTWTGPRSQSRSIAEWGDWMERVVSDWVSEQAILEPLTAGLRQAARLRPRLQLQTETLQRLLLAASAPRTHSDPADRDGVTVVPLMRARGLTARRLIVLGLAAGAFPMRVEEDPLLSDQSRRRLRTAGSRAGHRLAVSSAVTTEMALLFFLLNSSAGRIHWVVPETDELGKSVSPTPWVQRYQQRWPDGALPRMPRGPRQQAETLLNLDEDGRLLPPSLGFLLDRRLAELVGDAAHYAWVGQTRRLQQLQPDWQGFIRAPGWRQPLPDPEDPPRVSVTRLESLSRCPYRFYAGQLAGWNPLELLQFTPSLTPLEWGSLVHRFLEVILHPALDRSLSLSERAAELRADDWAVMRRLSDQLPPKLSASFRFLPSVLADAARSRLFRQVSGYLATIGDSCADGRVEALELYLRRSVPELEPLLVSGVIDRVDRDEGGQLTVVDYKTGVEPRSTARRRAAEIELGFYLQPWLYPWLLPDADRQRPARFRYLYLGGPEPSEVEVETPGEPATLLQPLGKILREGYFFPTSNETLSAALGQPVEPCLYCALPSLCRRFESRRTRQALRWLLTWVPERFSIRPPEESS